MAATPSSPIGSLDEFGTGLRRGDFTAEGVTAAYLARIEALDPQLGAFEFVAGEAALASARALDRLLAAGTDLGPLMGVSVAVKDIFAVDGMPTRHGSKVDVSDLVRDQGRFVDKMKQSGCVILGKTKTVEFALGALGTNAVRGTPHNPWDAATARAPGGSSSGSAVAVAAGLCAFAIGSDTGGSVRLPSAFCGTFGIKTTHGLWPTDGVFPLAPHLDCIGLLTRSAADAAIAFAALSDLPPPQRCSVDGLRFGRPDYFFENLDLEVDVAVSTALDALAAAGAEIIPLSLPEAAERETFFPNVLPAELIAALGRERYLSNKDIMDPVVSARAEKGLEVLASDYLRAVRRQRELVAISAEKMQGMDGWIGPTIPMLPPALSALSSLEKELSVGAIVTQNSQVGNLFELCGISLPIRSDTTPLPIGLQILCPPGQDAAALSIGLAIEDLLGPPTQPDLAAFDTGR